MTQNLLKILINFIDFGGSGDFCIRKANGMTVFKQLLLRLWLVTIGRFNANLTRSIVQKIAITESQKLIPLQKSNFRELQRSEGHRFHPENAFKAFKHK